MGEIEWTLEKTLEELGLTKNALAVEAKVRPATIGDMVKNVPRRVEFKTLTAILDVMNEKSSREIKIEDVFVYKK